MTLPLRACPPPPALPATFADAWRQARAVACDMPATVTLPLCTCPTGWPCPAHPPTRRDGAPVVRVQRRRDATGDLLPGWWLVWSTGARLELPTFTDAWRRLDDALRS